MKRTIYIFLVLIIGITSTAFLFVLNGDIQDLYERKNSLDIAYAIFWGLHPLTLANPVQALSDSYTQFAYRNLYFSIHEKEPSNEVLNEVRLRASYENHVKELFETPEDSRAKNIISNNIKKKQTWQLIAFVVLILSQLGGGYFAIKHNIKDVSKNKFMTRLIKILLLPIIIIVIVAIHFALRFFYPGLNYVDWIFIESMVLAITAVAIGFQAYYTKKHVELSAKNITLSVIPGVFFALRSLRTIYKRSGQLNSWETISRKEKLRTQFIVQNNSRFPVLFKVKITFRFNDKKLFHDYYWENALHINPGAISYPDVVHLKDIIVDKEINDEQLENIIESKKDKEIFVDIEYQYTPKSVEIYSEPISERWRFNLKEFIWVGPNGIRDENIYLPGENR